jgi:phenylacetate-coenzyme A ligase PaaK-like adenylate-forming protein
MPGHYRPKDINHLRSVVNGRCCCEQLIVSRSGERDELVAKIELADEAVDEARLSVLLSERFPQVCRVRLDRIEYVPKGTIPQERRTIVDQRRWE